MTIDAKSLKTCAAGLAAGAGLAVVAKFNLLPVSSPLNGTQGPGIAATESSQGGFLSNLAGNLGSIGAPPIDYAQFAQGEIIKALKERDFAALNADEVKTIAYLSGLNDEISGQGVLLYTNDRAIYSVVDPSLSTDINRRLMTSSQYMERSTQAGMNALTGMITSMANARRSGATVGEELSAMMKGAANAEGGMPVQQWMLQGQKDARVLAGYFTTNRREFEKIYSGISEYLRSEGPTGPVSSVGSEPAPGTPPNYR